MAKPQSHPLAARGVTRAEAEVLLGVREYLSNAEIAARQHVSRRTVESHVASLIRKLEVANRRELARVAGALLAADDAPATRIPVFTGALFGRTDEADDLVALLRTAHQVSVVGPPGVEKTRLAVEVAARVASDYPDGVWFVDLAPVVTDTAVADRVLAACGGTEIPHKTVEESLVAQLLKKRALVVLDNCEHVLPGSAAVAQALQGNRHLALLLTSREPLGTPGERVRLIEPLAVPTGDASTDAVAATDAYRLLAERAAVAGAPVSLTDATTASVRELCRKLDGLPLALELIAPRLRTFRPGQVSRLLDEHFALVGSQGRGRPDRHQTLHHAIAWSYDVLEDVERLLFERLAVFSGSFSLSAMTAVCADATVRAPTVVALLPRLVERSLVAVDVDPEDNRYRLLESLRAFATMHLDATDAEQVPTRHCSHFVEYAERARPHLRGPESMEWLDRLRRDWDNMTAALDWATRRAPEDALRLVAALHDFWEAAGLRRSGIDWAGRALDAGRDAPAHLRIAALEVAVSILAPWDTGAARGRLTEAESLLREVDSPEWEARIALLRGLVEVYDGNRDAGAAAVHRALTYFRSADEGLRSADAMALLSLGAEGDEALGHLAHARELYREAGDRAALANTSYLAANRRLHDLRDYEMAKALARETVDLAIDLGSEREELHGVSVLAECAFAGEDLDQADELVQRCLPGFEKVADHRCVSRMLLLAARIAESRADYAEALRAAERACDIAQHAGHEQTLPEARLLIERVRMVGPRG